MDVTHGENQEEPGMSGFLIFIIVAICVAILCCIIYITWRKLWGKIFERFCPKKNGVKVFTIVKGQTWNADRAFVGKVAAKAQLSEVTRLDECDVILVFCPVASRHGPDIDAALKEIPANKPAVLVVMNHTIDPYHPVYDSSNYVYQSDVLSVDCVFHESSGFFECGINDGAVVKTLEYMKRFS